VPIRLSRTGNSTREAGYTLVELLVVLAIIGLIILAVPVLIGTMRPGVESKAAAHALVHDLRVARETAIQQGVETRVVMNAAGRSYVVSGGAVHVLPRGVPLSFNGPRGNEIRFYPDGSSTGGTVLVGSPKLRHRIVAHWLTGQISLDE
jgi:general secretion pathway protein H